MKAALYLAIEAPTDLVRQVAAVELVNQPTHSAHDPARFAGGRIVGICDADNPYAPVFEPTYDRFAVNRVARQPIQRFDDQYIEFACKRCSMHCACA